MPNLTPGVIYRTLLCSSHKIREKGREQGREQQRKRREGATEEEEGGGRSAFEVFPLSAPNFDFKRCVELERFTLHAFSLYTHTQTHTHLPICLLEFMVNMPLRRTVRESLFFVHTTPCSLMHFYCPHLLFVPSSPLFRPPPLHHCLSPLLCHLCGIHIPHPHPSSAPPASILSCSVLLPPFVTHSFSLSQVILLFLDVRSLVYITLSPSLSPSAIIPRFSGALSSS